MKLAVIPARGGSKRIPRKNIKEFCGKPMIAYSIEAAAESECFDRVVVSTDDPEIAEVAIRYGAEVPFFRPAGLSDDFTGTIPVVKHAIEALSGCVSRPTFVCCLYATAPFVNARDLRIGLEMLSGSDADYAFSVTSYAFPIQRAIRINLAGRVEMLNPSLFNTRSQDLEETYHDAGQFYWGRAEAWCEQKVIFGPDSLPVVLPRYRVQDIDVEEDWLRAEWLFKAITTGTGRT
jgi:pseudaminic acid cytidylyltransferase